MNPRRYSRSVSMNCPTCGATDFEFPESQEQALACARCGRRVTREDLIQENDENIAQHAKEITNDVLRDAKKAFSDSLRKAFRGNRNIRFK